MATEVRAAVEAEVSRLEVARAARAVKAARAAGLGAVAMVQ